MAMKSLTDGDIAALQEKLRAFAKERDWEQFHSPKNLSMALTVEAGELQEIFQWLTEAQSRALPPAQQEHAAEEMADVLLYLCRLADELGVDLVAAANTKLAANAAKYPASEVRGKSDKRH
jgi:NTP pyrophosphatase (non-canonical NTP hydrolase)